MQETMALRGRGQLAVLLHSLLHAAAQAPGWRAPDPRNVRTWQQFVLGVLVARSSRLLAVARGVAPQRRVTSVKAAAEALGYLLKEARFALRPFSSRLLLAAVDALDPTQLITYRGKVLLVIDPTEYPKRSRGRGKRGRQMQHIGRVRKAAKGAPRRPKQKKGAGKAVAAKGQRVATTYGYVDIWAGLVLKAKRFLPLARHLFSSTHPKLKSQNRVEEAVLGMARGLLRRLGLVPLIVGDRGLGRKELLIRLAQEAQAFVFRIDADITAGPAGQPPTMPLATLLSQQPWLGTALWQGGDEGPWCCQVRTVRATIRYSRTGRKDDYTEATLQFVELVPLAGDRESLVLATTLPVRTRAEARGIAWVYAQRWCIETGFETLKAWGLERFMVRPWEAIDRLLWIVALAYTLIVLALQARPLARLRQQATALLQQQSVLGRRLTIGKLAEAIGLDFARHRRAWAAVWRL